MRSPMARRPLRDKPHTARLMQREWRRNLFVQIPLEADEGIADCGNTPELVRGVWHGVIFQLQQMRQLGLIKLADAFFDVLRRGQNPGTPGAFES